MANTIVLKRSAVENKAPTTSDLSLGELGLNTYDGKAYMKTDQSGTAAVVEVGSKLSSLHVTGVADFDSDISVDGVAVFDGAFLGKEGFQFRTTTNDLEPTQGAGLEFWYQQSSARYVLQTYDRGSGSLQPLQLASSNWSLYSGGDADFNGTVEVGKSSASETHAYGIIAKSSVTADSAQSSTIYARNLASGGRLWYGAAYDSASTNTSYILENGTAYFANFTDGSTTVSAANVVNTKAALTAIKAACNDSNITTVAGLKTAIADALANF